MTRKVLWSIAVCVIALGILFICFGATQQALVLIDAPAADAGKPCRIVDYDKDTDILLEVKRVSQHIPYADDGDSKLCWAAGLSMVTSYLGHPSDLCKIAALRPDAQVLSCCRRPEDMDERSITFCNQGATSSEIEQVISRLKLYRTHVTHPIAEADLMRELAHGRPVYVDRENGETYQIQDWVLHGRHAVVVIGRMHGKYLVLDPSTFKTDAPEVLTFEGLLHGVGGNKPWRETWYGLSFRSDRCNPGFIPGCDCEKP